MEELINELEKNVKIDEKFIYEKKIVIENISLLKVRDKLYGIAHISSIDEDRGIMVISSKANKKSNIATIAIKVSENRILMVGYAKEGMIKQNTVEKEFKRIENVLIGEKEGNKNKLFGLFCVIIFLGITTSLLFINKNNDNELKKIIKATGDYNVAVDKYNELAQCYNEKHESGYFDELDIPEKIEMINKVDNDKNNAKKQIKEGNTEEKIRKDIESINELIVINQSLVSVVESFITPKEENIINVLKTVSGVTEVEAVTENNDPNSMLGKDGGYYSCIYFGLEGVQQDLVNGESIVDKGTDAGGAIEIYSSVDDAKTRCEYLSQFDGSILTTGSYTLIGTMVIRLSYQLDAGKQNEVIKTIIESFS